MKYIRNDFHYNYLIIFLSKIFIVYIKYSFMCIKYFIHNRNSTGNRILQYNNTLQLLKKLKKFKSKSFLLINSICCIQLFKNERINFNEIDQFANCSHYREITYFKDLHSILEFTLTIRLLLFTIVIEFNLLSFETQPSFYYYLMLSCIKKRLIVSKQSWDLIWERSIALSIKKKKVYESYVNI